MGALTFEKVLEKSHEIERRIEELETSLTCLRRSHQEWEKGVELDERFSVKLLYKTLCEARAEYRKFLDTVIVETRAP